MNTIHPLNRKENHLSLTIDCLLAWGFLAPIENFLLTYYLIITEEGLQTLTYTRHASMAIEQ